MPDNVPWTLSVRHRTLAKCHKPLPDAGQVKGLYLRPKVICWIQSPDLLTCQPCPSPDTDVQSCLHASLAYPQTLTSKGCDFRASRNALTSHLWGNWGSWGKLSWKLRRGGCFSTVSLIFSNTLCSCRRTCTYMRPRSTDIYCECQLCPSCQSCQHSHTILSCQSILTLA